MMHKTITTAILLFLLFNVTNLKAQHVEILVTGIRSAEGRIVIGVYKNNQDFKDDNTYVRKKFNKSKMKNGNLLVSFDLTPGAYGFSLLDDEDDNDKMNFSFIGIPKEGYAFSNYVHSGLTRPDFERFRVDVKKGKNKQVIMKMKYML